MPDTISVALPTQEHEELMEELYQEWVMGGRQIDFAVFADNAGFDQQRAHDWALFNALREENM